MPSQLNATVGAFLRSFLYTLTSTGSLFLLLAVTNGGTSPLAAWHWMEANYWPFLVAQFISPTLRAHAAANLYAPIPTKVGE